MPAAILDVRDPWCARCVKALAEDVSVVCTKVDAATVKCGRCFNSHRTETECQSTPASLRRLAEAAIAAAGRAKIAATAANQALLTEAHRAYVKAEIEYVAE